MKNHKTPIKEVLFRASKVGVLASGLLRFELTDNQKKEVQELKAKKDELIGLTEPQQKKLDKLVFKQEKGHILTKEQNSELVDLLKEKDEKGAKFSTTKQKKIDKFSLIKTSGNKLTQEEQDIFNEYNSRLTRKKGLTEKQAERLKELEDKAKKEPELSEGAKTWIKEVWLFHEKGFKDPELNTKQIRKGKGSEEDGIKLISLVDGILYRNNNDNANGGRLTVKNLTGACDIVTNLQTPKIRVVDDIKASWNPKTFMNTGISTIEKWQGISYMYLYNAGIFRLRRVLVDCPPDVLEDEYHNFRFINRLREKDFLIYDSELFEQLKQGQICIDYIKTNNETQEEANAKIKQRIKVKKLVDQFHTNFLYEYSGNYTKEERVKTFTVVRDLELEKILLHSIDLALEYYKTITLNMID